MGPEQAPAPGTTASPDDRRSGDLLRNLSLRGRLLILFGVVALFLAATTAAQLAFQARLADARDDVILRLDPATEAVHELGTAVTDERQGAAGYAETGEGLLLDLHERGRRAVDQAVSRLDDLLQGPPEIGGEADAVFDALRAWRASAQGALDSAAGRPEALAADAPTFQALRRSIDALDAEVERARGENLDRLDDSNTAGILVVAVQVAGILVLAALITAALSRQVLRPLANLGADARHVAAGDLDRPVRGEGAPDLLRIGDDVEAMRARIVDELSELSAARADLEHQAAELARSNDDLEQFAYVASHDLQEPLRKVAGFCQLLERRYGHQLDDRAHEYIWYADDGARRMQDLINDLLSFSRVGRSSEDFGPVDLGEVAGDVLATLDEPITTSGADVHVGDMPTVHGNRRLLTAVLQNLVGNALKFRGTETPRVDVTATAGAGEWTIAVADNGIGIRPEHADQIFTIFQRLHKKGHYAGTGIGLALARKIVEHHGGHIWLVPGDAPGATFCFTLPTDATSEVALEGSDIDPG